MKRTVWWTCVVSVRRPWHRPRTDSSLRLWLPPNNYWSPASWMDWRFRRRGKEGMRRRLPNCISCNFGWWKWACLFFFTSSTCWHSLCSLPLSPFLQNIHSTSQRAMRSGDGGTIADLSVSHHKSLQLMRQQSRQLEEMVTTAETRKAKITHHIHEVILHYTASVAQLVEHHYHAIFF